MIDPLLHHMKQSIRNLITKYNISAPNNSVAVIPLIKAHRIRTKEMLIKHIYAHHLCNCKCGVKSTGAISNFVDNLMNAQLKEYGKHKFTRNECGSAIHEMFITNSLRGAKNEERAIQDLRERLRLECISVVESGEYMDILNHIDAIALTSTGKAFAGIQVKSEYWKKRKKKRPNVAFPVVFLYYNNRDQFTNIDDVVAEIKTLYLYKPIKKN